jgi:hypothetical protein
MLFNLSIVENQKEYIFQDKSFARAYHNERSNFVLHFCTLLQNYYAEH